MGNTTALICNINWKTDFHLGREWKTSPEFGIKGLSEPKFTVSVRSEARKYVAVKVSCDKSKIMKKNWRKAFIEIDIEIVGNVLESTRRLYNFTNKSKLFIWERETDYEVSFKQFDKFRVIEDNNLKSVYCKIRWYGPIKKMPVADSTAYNMQEFLGNDQFSDVTLVVENEEIPAHKIVLAGQSPVFAAMLTTQMRESLENKVNIQNADVDTVKIILRYLYTGNCMDLSDPGVLWNVFNFARMYEMNDLKLVCERKLMRNLSIEDVVGMLDATTDINAKMLYEIMKDNNFVISKKAPKYPTEFTELMKCIFETGIDTTIDQDVEAVEQALMIYHDGNVDKIHKADVLWNIFNVTKKYNLIECRNFCEKNILRLLTCRNLLIMLDDADSYGSKVVYWRALQLAVQQRGRLSAREDFKELCRRKPNISIDFLEFWNSQKHERKGV